MDTLNDGAIARDACFWPCSLTNNTVIDTYYQKDFMDSLINRYNDHNNFVIAYFDTGYFIDSQYIWEYAHLKIDTIVKGEGFGNDIWWEVIALTGTCEIEFNTWLNNKFLVFYDSCISFEDLGIKYNFCYGPDMFIIKNDTITKPGINGLPGIGVYLYDFLEKANNQDKIENTVIILNSNHISINPNPFNRTTTITLQLKNNETANISIFNIKGELIKEIKNVSSKEILWNAYSLPSSLYIIKVYICEKIYSKKMFLKR